MNLIGTRFKKLVIISAYEGKGTQIKWLCQCDCGNQTVVRTYNLGRTGSCGCSRKHGQDISYNTLYLRYKNSAKRRNLHFSISITDLIHISKQPCHYCKRLYVCKLVSNPQRTNQQSKNEQLIYYNGIDRKDNTKGYVLENCLPCCKVCNRAKNNSSYEEFMEWIECIKKS
jgi:hypothetical protein